MFLESYMYCTFIFPLVLHVGSSLLYNVVCFVLIKTMIVINQMHYVAATNQLKILHNLVAAKSWVESL